MAWASALPDRVGELSLVMPSPGVPESLPASSTGAAGATGIAVSIVSVSTLEAALVLPARSRWTTVSACTPSSSGRIDAMLQAPAASAVVLPSQVVPL